MSGLRIYNTLTRRKDPFEPIEAGKVRMYVCGPTVYDSFHLGHARAAVVFDAVRRYLEYRGFEVTFVTNFTDVDDKIIKRAGEELAAGADIKAACAGVSKRYIDEYFAVTDALGVKRATHYPKATEEIGAMQKLVRTLVEKGHAYAAKSPHAPGASDVYFSVESFGNYGALSGKGGARDVVSRVAGEPNKHAPEDFALWKASKPGEPAWDSPWGPGRPGWHIECSAMSAKHLGVPFDIHGGGADLVFPHHENEIAQSECAFGRPFARVWMHNGFLKPADDAEKMSKSLGNVVWLKDVLEERSGSAVRLFLLGTHYRQPVAFAPRFLDAAEAGLERIRNALFEAARVASGAAADEARASDLVVKSDEARTAFRAAMDDDFNTPGALAPIYDLVRAMNEVAAARRAPSEEERKGLETAAACVHELAGVLGLDLMAGEGSSGGADAEAEKLLAARGEARKHRDFAEADRLRDELAAMGYEIKDRPDGTSTLRKKG